MPVIVNVRGTSGSGKSTLIRMVMDQYAKREPVYIPGRKQPLYYILHDLVRPPGLDAPLVSAAPLVVLGHYESPCGGCDTISHDDTGKGNSYDRIFGLVREHYAQGHNVLFEGLLISGDAARCLALKRDGAPLHIVTLSLPIEECLAAVRARREAKGNLKPLDPQNTIDKHKLLAKCVVKLRQAGIPIVECWDRALAYHWVRLLLGIAPDFDLPTGGYKLWNIEPGTK